MSDVDNTVTQSASTAIDADGAEALAVGAGGQHPVATTAEDAGQPKSLRESIEASAKRVDDEQAKGERSAPDKGDDARATDEAKAQAAVEKKTREANVQAEKPRSEQAQANENPDGDTAPQKQETEADKKYRTPPQRFMPKAQEVWINTPNAVKAEVARMEREFEDERRSMMEVRQTFEKLAPYEAMAKQGGTTLDAALEKYIGIETMLRENPVQGVANILQNLNLTPQQYAQIVMENSPRYQALMMQQRPQPQATPQPDPHVTALERQLAQERAARVSAEVIGPFAAGRPRFEELQNDIAFFLNSGKIPASMSPAERLEAAYDMAERLNPRSASSAQISPTASVAQSANPRAGTASVKGSPSSGISNVPARRGKISRRDALARAADLADASR